MHLVVDGYGGDIKVLQSEELIYDFLDRYPDSIGMNKISAPYVMTYVGSKPRDWGISGFVLIAESHISVHTFPEHSYVNIDIFSCKEFDSQKAIEDLQKRLGLKSLRSYVLNRGLEQFYTRQVESEPAESLSGSRNE